MSVFVSVVRKKQFQNLNTIVENLKKCSLLLKINASSSKVRESHAFQTGNGMIWAWENTDIFSEEFWGIRPYITQASQQTK